MATVYLRDVKGRLCPINSELVSHIVKHPNAPTVVVFENGKRFESSDDLDTVLAHTGAK